MRGWAFGSTMVPGNARRQARLAAAREGGDKLNASFSPASGTRWHLECGGSRSLPMRTTLKWLLAGAVILTAAQADAGEFLAPGPLGPRYAAPYGRSYVPSGYRPGYIAPRYYYVAEQRPDLGAAIAGALAGAALQLIPRAAEAPGPPLPPARAPGPLPPPAGAAPPPGALPAGPSGDALDDIEGNARGITREEVEAALVDWCASHGDAPLCRKLQVR